MRVVGLRIENFKSFSDSGELTFSSGINLLVGRNNAGKSALLQAVSLRAPAHPHLSLKTVKNFGDPVSPNSVFSLTLAFEGSELRPMLLANRSAFRLVWSINVPWDPANALKVLNYVLGKRELRATAKRFTSASSAGFSQPNLVGLNGYDHEGDGEQRKLSIYGVTSDMQGFESQGIGEGLGRDDVGLVAVQLLSSRIYIFDAQRSASGKCSIGVSDQLRTDASNLAEVLNTLQSNPAKYDLYLGLVREIFPDLYWISVTTINVGGLFYELRLWLAPKESQRQDLSVTLSECGTGLGQVLAILYVVATSNYPIVIGIDEPNSFLHPEASRALISIIKRFPQHQYIISTHSPEIIAEAGASTLTLLEKNDAVTTCTQLTSLTLEAVSQALKLVGARLSDVFGYDSVLWVEGPSDVPVVEKILAKEFPTPHKIAVCAVRNTSEFEKQTIDQVIDIYRRLTQAKTLLPPTLGFLFDRELRSEEEIADAGRRDVKIRFLKRRMMENYFLAAGPITHLLTALKPPLPLLPKMDEVDEWLQQMSAGSPSRDEWLAKCHGKKIIRECLAKFTGATHRYSEVEHLPLLADWCVENAPGDLADICQLLKEFVPLPAA
jgi:predicted ATPase